MHAWITILLLLFLGFILLLIELFIIPGFGLVGISGLILLFVASYLSFKVLNVIAGIGLSVGSFVLVIILIRLFSKRLLKAIGLEEKERRDRGFSTSLDYNYLLGREGKALTPLRPTGVALIEGKKINVLTEGMWIEKETKIKVVKVEGNKIFVRGG